MMKGGRSGRSIEMGHPIGDEGGGCVVVVEVVGREGWW